MAHPFAHVRQHKVERDRAQKMGGGSRETHPDVSEDRKLVRSMVKSDALKVEGRASGGRLDKYARGGKVKKPSTTVNVIVAQSPRGGEAPVGLPPAPPPIAGAMPPGPPISAGMPPMMPHKHGGRAYATGGGVKDGPAWKEGLKNGTQVQDTPGKNDTGDIYRPRQITYATGGPVEAPKGRGPKMHAGADSGEGRLEKARLQKRKG